MYVQQIKGLFRHIDFRFRVLDQCQVDLQHQRLIDQLLQTQVTEPQVLPMQE
jgi:hypothetical protein